MVHIGSRTLSLRKVAMIIVDMILVTLSLWGALLVRFDGTIPASYLVTLAYFILPFIASGLVLYFIFGFYDQIWRFASVREYATIYLGTILHAQLMAALMTLLKHRFPWSVYLIFWMMAVLAIIGVRVAFRFLQARFIIPEILNHEISLPFVARANVALRPAPALRRVMIVGAGSIGSQIIRELLNHHTHVPVVVIDDDKQTHSFRILGIPVVGDRYDIPTVVDKYKIDMIVLAIPSASRRAVREIVEISSRTTCELKIIPNIHEMIDGKVTVADIKDVEIEDLLGRDEVQLDTDAIAGYLKDQVVLVTGGGGSIGSELCRQIAVYQPKLLIVFDIYENNAYQLQYELKAHYNNDLNLRVLIGSVRDGVRLDKIFKEYRPSVVFHAAAHKHVPLMEDSPGEAVKNNILGTCLVAETAIKYQAKRFVLISTDKAVNPTNVMGSTKRIAEMMIQTLSLLHPATHFAAVRFGNVLGSNGSVIPIFKQQIRNERRVTVTHPDITRYFMTIPEAARLVIQAGAFAERGDIFVLDMGEPVKILDLAKDLIRLSGLEPDSDVKIEFTGLRPGEKMYEELMLDKENLDTTKHKMIFRLKPIHDGTALQKEVNQLRRIIRWENEEFRDKMEWMIRNYEVEEKGA